MHSRPFIRSSDKTTSSGDIQAPFNGMTAGDDNLNVCFEGNPVFCPACKSMGVTKCIPPFRQFTGFDGRQVNLEGDLCICHCHLPPRLLASQTSMTMDFSASEMPAVAKAADLNSAKFDEQVRFLTDEKILEGIPFFIHFEDGRTISGYVSQDGLLPRVVTEGVGFYHIYWGDDALEKMETQQ